MPAKKRSDPKRISQLSDSYVDRAWKNVLDPAGLSSLSDFARSRKTGRKLRDLERSLSKIEAFSRHRPVRKKITRPAIILHEVKSSYCSDLMEFQNKYHNKGHRFVLILQDQMSKQLALEPMRRKTKEETAKALEKAFKKLKPTPGKAGVTLTTDFGKEYSNFLVRRLLQKLGIKHRIAKSFNKASICERSNRRIKEVLFKWLSLHNSKDWYSILPVIEKKYNTSKHMAHNFRPIDVTSKTQDEAFSRMMRRLVMKKRPDTIYKVGDRVRIAERANIFTKQYKPGYSKQIYKIIKVLDSYPVWSFRLATLAGEELEQLYVAQELSLAE